MGFADRLLYRRNALEVLRFARAMPITVLPALPSLLDRLSNRWVESPILCGFAFFLQPR
jgi:hypothetical protein